MDIIEINCEDERYPKRLLKIKNFPSKLYVAGNIELLNSRYTVGIVGSRKCSEYGRKVAYEFAREISESGICVVSGMAVGIDGMAHNGAVGEIGRTIAVLGSGFNHIYPNENEWLFHKILENCGCVISEYTPNVEADTKNFPKRNRIISGISDSILVVEAKYRSGSSITTKYAKEQGKIVYAIPNNIYASSGLGTNMMIQDGAILTLRAEEIVKNIKNDKICNDLENDNTTNNLNLNIKKNGRRKINFKNDKIKENSEKIESSRVDRKEKQIDREYLPIYKLLSYEPIHINELARKLKMTIQEITPIITMMEIEGYLEQVQTNYFVRND